MLIIIHNPVFGNDIKDSSDDDYKQKYPELRNNDVLMLKKNSVYYARVSCFVSCGLRNVVSPL